MGLKSTIEMAKEITIVNHTSLAVNNSDLILAFSPDGELLSRNWGGVGKNFGNSQAMDFVQLLPKNVYKQLTVAFWKALHGRIVNKEMELKDHVNKIYSLHLTFFPMRKSGEGVAGVYIIVRDYSQLEKVLQDLERKQQHFKHAQEIANVASWEYSLEEHQLECSEHFYTLFGIEKNKKITMKMLYTFIHPDDRKKVIRTMVRVMKKGIAVTGEFRFFHAKTGEKRYIKLKTTAVRKHRQPCLLFGVIHDITRQKQLELEIAAAEKDFKHIFDQLHVGIWSSWMDGGVIYASQGLAEILQIPLPTLYKNTGIWKEMILPPDRREIGKKYTSLLRGKAVEQQLRVVCGDGNVKWLHAQIIPRANEHGEISQLFGMVIDITPEMEVREKLDYIAANDPLTALPNQQSLYTKLDDLCRKGNPFVLLNLDLDQFYRINNSLGYEIGDNVLKQIANRITSILPEDGYAARLDGNDFVIVIPKYASKKAVYALAESLITLIEQPIKTDGYDLHITTSIGISFFPEDGDNILSILGNAQTALFHAKAQGKNNFQLYSFSSETSSYKKYLLEKDLRQAIKRVEFELYYQPLVNPYTGKIEGAEALIRWNHRKRGLISPGEFIPLAEENHLIHEIGDWVLQQACAQLRSWKDKGLPFLPISVNLSPLRFLKKGLEEVVYEQLEHYQIPAKYVYLEITENTFLKSDKYVLRTLENLRDLGVKIVFDDFGTGYASLNYLLEFHADVIKIDKVFIQSLHKSDKKETAIVSSILHLAKKLGIKTVAEGVEEYEQYDILTAKGCDLIQGYLYSKPVPAKDFERLLDQGCLTLRKQGMTPAPEIDRRK